MKRLAGLALLLACSDAYGPADFGAIRFDPPRAYQDVWLAAEDCTGRTGDYWRIRWWVVPGVEEFTYQEGQPKAAAGHQGNDIVIGGQNLDKPWMIRHEMIHQLGFGVGDEHPDPPFDRPCKALWPLWDTTEARLALPASLRAYMVPQ